MAIDFQNFSNVLTKNGMLKFLGNIISSNFTITGDVLENPFIISSPKRQGFNPLVRDDIYNQTVSKKREIYAKNPKIISHKFFLIDGIKLIEFVDPTYIIDENTKEIDIDLFKEAVFYIGKNKVLLDLQVTILRALIQEFVIYENGAIKPREQTNNEIYSAEDPEHEKIRCVFELPFNTYYNAIQRFPKELVDDVVMSEEHKYFKNDRLPVKVLPLLVRETLVTKDDKPYTMSYRQMYKAYHSPKKRFVRNACPRQSGKTYDAVRDCYMRLLSGDHYRIIYICENETAFEQPRNYFEMAFKKAVDYGIIEMNKSDFTIRSPFGGKTGNTLTFISSVSKLGPRSFNGNYFVFDEGGKIKTSVRLDAYPIINNANASVLVNSTIFWEMKKLDSERFYNNLLAIEMGFKIDEDGIDEWMALRVNIDQIEWLSDKQKNLSKNELRPYPNRYFCELYSQLPNADNSVVPDGFFTLIDKDTIDKSEFLLLGRDLAKRVDTAGMVLLAEKDGIFFEENRLRGYTYTQQINIVKELKQMYPHLLVVADVSNEESFLENNGDLIDYPIKFTSATSGYKKEFRDGITIRSVGKEVIVNTFVELAEQGKLKALASLEMLRMEAENYIAKRNGRGGLSYGASAGTDDLMSAVLCASFIYKVTYLDPLDIRERHRQKQLDNQHRSERDTDLLVGKRSIKGFYNNMY